MHVFVRKSLTPPLLVHPRAKAAKTTPSQLIVHAWNSENADYSTVGIWLTGGKPPLGATSWTMGPVPTGVAILLLL